MPGARFNPPPGWPVPKDWTPPADWVPDPSWPPAPAGWQFFVEDDAAPEQQDQPRRPRRSRRRIALFVGAAAAVFILVAATVVAVVWFTDSGGAHPRPVGMLPGTYPTQPAFAWSVQAASLAHKPDTHFVTPLQPAQYSELGAIVTGDHIIVRLRTFGDDGPDNHLVSLNASDGHLEWSVSITLSGCADALLDNTLPCLTGDGTVQFLDVTDGSTTSSVQTPFDAEFVETDGHRLYTLGHDGSTIIVAGGSSANPTASWKTTVPQDNCVTTSAEMGISLHVAHGLFWGISNVVPEVAVTTGDGSLLFDHGVTDVTVAADGSRIAAARCDGTPNQYRGVTDVVDHAGRALFTSQDSLQHVDLDVHTGGPAPVVTRRGDVLDPDTGEKRAHIGTPSANNSSSMRSAWLVGNVIMLSGDGAYDINSGHQLWDHATELESPSAFNGNAVTDGVRLMFTNGSEGIDAVTIADGTTAWSIADAGGMLYATDAGLLSVSGSTIGLLRPTGPAAAVPGNTAEANAGGSGGTRLVTKCGRTPQFVPEAVHTDSGALVIRMKIEAFCPGGDVLSAPDTRITVTSGGQNVAAGTFDLSKDPIVIAPDPDGSDPSRPSIEHDFRFPLGTFWRLPVSTNHVPTGGASSQGPVDLGVKTLVVGCQESGAADTSAPSPNSDSSTPVAASTATGPAAPASGDNESASLDALRAIADADRPFVTSHLTDHWVPQLSSKRPGVVDDGITYDNAATLREHLKLRLKYPEARLLWSGDWSTFSAPDFWVTISGMIFPGADGALAWCRDHHRDSDHCYAKLISKTHPVEGSTAYNP